MIASLLCCCDRGRVSVCFSFCCPPQWMRGFSLLNLQPVPNTLVATEHPALRPGRTAQCVIGRSAFEKALALLLVLVLLAAVLAQPENAHAAPVGNSVRGVVHDASAHSVEHATVSLKSTTSAWIQTT